jgi:hypothetical protein
MGPGPTKRITYCGERVRTGRTRIVTRLGEQWAQEEWARKASPAEEPWTVRAHWEGKPANADRTGADL